MKTPILHDADYWINRPMDSEKDWVDDQPDWVESYFHSTYHPHRQLIVDAIKEMYPIKNILELGCGTGSNLLRIQEIFPRIKLAGIDVSKKCIDRAKDYLESATFKIGNYLTIPFPTKFFDVILADATLMYIAPKDIDKVFEEIDRVTQKGVIIVDRLDKSKKGVRSGHVWARNYPTILEDLGLKVKITKIMPEQWPDSKGWAKLGHIIVGEREENFNIYPPYSDFHKQESYMR
jgi:SAM-dependent methyltransferase